MLKRTKIGFFAAFLATTSIAHAQDTTSENNWDTVVATVNGTDITLGNMIIARETLPEQYLTLEDGVLFQGILDNLVQQTVLAQSIEGKTSKRDNTALENDARTYLAGSVVETILSDAVTEDALNALFDEIYVNGTPDEEFNAAHILVEKEVEAELIVKLLAEGSDFAKLAREKSTGPSGPNGGNLGWFSRGAMVLAFEEAVLALENGAYSAPVKSDFGWHVIHRIESRVKDVPELDAVRDELAAELQQRGLAAAIESLSASAEIKLPEEGAFDPAVLKDPALVGE